MAYIITANILLGVLAYFLLGLLHGEIGDTYIQISTAR